MTIAYKTALAAFKRQYWAEALAANGGDASKTAKATGVYRTYVYRILDTLGLSYVPNGRHGNKGNAAWRALKHKPYKTHPSGHRTTQGEPW